MEKDDKTEASLPEQEALPEIALDDRRFQELDRRDRDERAEEEEESAARVPFHDSDAPMST